MSGIVGTLIILLSVMLQTAVISRLPLLNGVADLVLLVLTAWILQDETKRLWIWALLAGGMVAVVSGLHWVVPLVGYIGVGFIVWLLKKRVWQTPIMALFITIFAGTILIHGLSLGSLFVEGTFIPIEDGLTLVTLPSTLLNLLLAIPVYVVIRDLSGWVHPGELEV